MPWSAIEANQNVLQAPFKGRPKGNHARDNMNVIKPMKKNGMDNYYITQLLRHHSSSKIN